jgi:hypothetical protein
MADDLAGAHAAHVDRDDLVGEPRKAALVLGDQLRIKPEFGRKWDQLYEFPLIIQTDVAEATLLDGDKRPLVPVNALDKAHISGSAAPPVSRRIVSQFPRLAL